MPALADYYASACEHYRAGRTSEAAEALRWAVGIDPLHHPSLQLLGTIAYGAGDAVAARGLFARAAEVCPGDARDWSCLGATCLALGQADEAECHHRRAVQLAPADPFVLSNFGIALASLGRAAEAVTALERARRADPADPEILCNLGAALHACGRAAEARAVCQESLQLAPGLAQAHVNLGNLLREQGELDEAIGCYRRALQLNARIPEAHRNLGMALGQRGRPREAVAAFRQALKLDPRDWQSQNHLAEALLSCNQTVEALAHARSALALQPGNALVLNTLGNALRATGDLAEAEASYREAVRRAPGCSVPAYNRAVTLQARGCLAESRFGLRAAMAANPLNSIAHGTYAGALFYDPEADADTILAEHRSWSLRHARPRIPPAPHANDPDPDRPLRVGYVSADFRNHAVAFFIRPILAHRNRHKVECFCYSDVTSPDERTAELRALADGWRDTPGLSDLELAELIRRDQIDLLVDLAGHLEGDRLRTFALRPAPVQISYLGYPGTTGLPEIDYRLTDAIADAPGAEAGYCERLVRLPGAFCCYSPPPAFTIMPEPPSRKAGVTTFGSLHKLEKINHRVVDLWCSILRELPRSRLLLARNVLRGAVATQWREMFERRGIGDGRLVLETPRPVGMGHLRVYEHIDVSLDTFPWSGHTTVCESLWMGVPAVTLRGERYAGRMVASLLAAAGLPELVAESAADYRSIALRLAADENRRAELRVSLRNQVLASRLCDGQKFTCGLEAAYRNMWQQWPRNQTVPHVDNAGGRKDSFGGSLMAE